jgi:hypothetical protein
MAIALAAARDARSAGDGSGSRPVLRWTDETPDAMLDDAASRALAPGATLPDALGALSVVASLSGRATDGHAKKALERVAAETHVPAEVRDQAALLARMVASDEGTDDGARADAKLGVVDSLAILGPFRDTGGGLDAHDGPEAGDFTDLGAAYWRGSCSSSRARP